MSEIELIESTISEYKNITETGGLKKNGKLDMDRLTFALSKEHDWTNQGAEALVYLATEYGSFMLRNALALSIALGQEDGNIGF